MKTKKWWVRVYSGPAKLGWQEHTHRSSGGALQCARHLEGVGFTVGTNVRAKRRDGR